MSKGKRLARMEICGTDDYGLVDQSPYWWRLRDGNGQVICYSEGFARKADARRAMKRALTIIQSGQYRVVDD